MPFVLQLLLPTVGLAAAASDTAAGPSSIAGVRFEPHGADAIVVTIMPQNATSVPPQYPSALLPAPPPDAAELLRTPTSLTNGNIRAKLTDGVVVFERVSDGAELLREAVPRSFSPVDGNSGFYSVDLILTAYDEERIYGLGQHQTGALDNKGQRFSLAPVNTEVLIPVMHSSRGYSLLWDLPSFGFVELGNATSHWHAEAAPFLRVWICATSAASSAGAIWSERMTKFTAAVGRAPVFPSWASGYWQSKNRYRNQTEVLEVVRGYRRRKLPLAMIVIDYHTWDDAPNAPGPHHTYGSDHLNPACWPDVGAMMAELSVEPRVEVMISPYYNFLGRNDSRFSDAARDGLLAVDADGQPHAAIGTPNETAMWDVYQSAARAEMMAGVVAGYVAPFGIKHFWLDCDEPCQSGTPATYGGMPAAAVGAAYPHMLARATREAMGPVGVNGSVMLGRSAWAGTQRLGAAVWSGDTDSSWKALNGQVRAALNMALSGIVYWTSDIGGYAGGGGGPNGLGYNHDIRSPAYLQLLTRWFQFGALCPLFRSHGHRLPELQPVSCDGSDSGGYNEVWHFAEPYHSAIVRVMRLREALRPYINTLYELAARDGSPVIRSLWYVFPTDPAAEDVDDQVMLGDRYLGAPVLVPNATSRSVYLPHLPMGEAWFPFFFNQTAAAVDGGQIVTVLTPLDTFPLFERRRK